jgi:hypothetical protein
MSPAETATGPDSGIFTASMAQLARSLDEAGKL